MNSYLRHDLCAWTFSPEEVQCCIRMFRSPQLIELPFAPDRAVGFACLEAKGAQGAGSEGSRRWSYVARFGISQLRELCACHSRVPVGSFSIVGIGLGTSAIAAFEHGQIDAGVLTSNAITGLERHSGVEILADTRTAEGTRAALGTDVYPAQRLAASPDWLRRNPATATKLARALMRTMRFMREHSAEEICSRLPAQFRSPDPEADLKAIRDIVPALSLDGKITPEGAQAVKKVLHVPSEKVRLARIDLSETYTNAFVP